MRIMYFWNIIFKVNVIKLCCFKKVKQFPSLHLLLLQQNLQNYTAPKTQKELTAIFFKKLVYDRKFSFDEKLQLSSTYSTMNNFAFCSDKHQQFLFWVLNEILCFVCTRETIKLKNYLNLNSSGWQKYYCNFFVTDNPLWKLNLIYIWVNQNWINLIEMYFKNENRPFLPICLD